jgi:hypothetical protein
MESGRWRPSRRPDGYDRQMGEAKKHPAASPVTWLLALCFLVAIDAAVTRTSLLWGPTAFEHTGGIRTIFPQTFQVMRKIYAPERDAEHRVAVLGNSRIAMALKEQRFGRALEVAAPDLDVDVSNLGMFGSFIGDTQVLARHLDALDPELVVLAVGGADMMRAPSNLPRARRLLRIGFGASSFAEEDLPERVDRWLRTVWPLYRFREFARTAILDRVLMRDDPGPPPETFATRAELFDQLFRGRADAVLAAYRTWEREHTLETYTDYLQSIGAGHLARGRKRAQSTEPLTFETPSVVVLDALVADFVAAGRPTAILLMPENPILADDHEGEFHRRELSAQAAGMIGTIAAKHGAAVVDARAWLPIEAFLDFDHPIIEMDVFDARLAAAIVEELRKMPDSGRSG